MKAQLTNTNDQVGMLLQMLSKVNKQEANTTRPAKDFLLRRLGFLLMEK
jgi:hypothetical protein